MPSTQGSRLESGGVLPGHHTRCTTFVCARTHPTGTHACTQVLRLRAATCASVLLFLVAAAPAAWGLQTRCLGLLRCVTAPRRARHATLVLRPRFCDSQRLHHCATHFRDCTAEFPSAPTTLLRLFPATATDCAYSDCACAYIDCDCDFTHCDCANCTAPTARASSTARRCGSSAAVLLALRCPSDATSALCFCHLTFCHCHPSIPVRMLLY
jgi:hypothetical protein